jgi:hypothetical protein
MFSALVIFGSRARKDFMNRCRQMQFGDGLADLAITFAVGDFDFRFHVAKAISLNRHDDMLGDFAFYPEWSGSRPPLLQDLRSFLFKPARLS